MLTEGSIEQNYLQLFLDDDFYEMTAEQTNLYAQQEHGAGRPNKRWKPVTGPEIQGFIGIIIYMRIVTFPQLDMYFQADFFQCPIVRNAMTRARCKLIKQYLHFNDNTKMPKLGSTDYDGLYKIRPVLNIINEFKYVYRPNRDISVDKAMIAYKGNFSAKQYMKDKPTPWGLKFWVIAEASTGFTLDAKQYLGKKEETDEDLLLGEQVVLSLSDFFGQKNHHLYCDNFFTSVRLFNELKENKIYGCRTIRQNRKEWPVEFKNPDNLKLKRVDFLQMQMNGITADATVWQDNHPVTVLSSNCDSTETVMLKKYSKKDKTYVEIPCPLPVNNYDKHMGKVDLADQKRTYYSISRPSEKWWKYYVYFILDACVINSHIIYNASEAKSITQLQFRQNLVKQLINNFSNRKQRIAVAQNMPEPDENSKSHILMKINGLRRSCALCSKEKKRKTKGYYVQTNFQYLDCDIPLCRFDCFSRFHRIQ